MNFGDNLRNLRKNKKMSQEDLAEKIGVSRQSVSKWETGDAYPEMTNILCLCDIFHCHINDLVHEDLVDLDSLDEEIKMSVVKFKQEKQRKMKGLSKTIYIFARIGKIVSIMGIILAACLMMLMPVMVNNVEVKENRIELFNEELKLSDDNKAQTCMDEEINNRAIKVIENNSNGMLIFYGEFICIFLLGSMVITFLMFKKLEELFENIHNGETPFTLENVKLIKAIAILLILANIVPNIGGGIGEIIMNTDLDIGLELMDVIYILVVFSLSYIFEYGYEIQLDSKGRIYGNENE